MNSYRSYETSLFGRFRPRLNVDPWLFGALVSLMVFGLIVLYSASGQSEPVIERQLLRYALGLAVLLGVAAMGVQRLYWWAPILYLIGLLMLLAVELVGDIGKGAQRWLDLGLLRFQPSEIMKLAMPMMLAFFFSERRLPPTWRDTSVALLLLAVPTLLIFLQPDLGTAGLVVVAGGAVIFFAGIRWRTLFVGTALVVGSVPVMWHFLRDYQRQRVWTFLDPESDPLGAGYHIIQSKIALGSGGIYGKGWLNGSQAQLQFLPERTTDFIFSVIGEEFGLAGALVLFSLYLIVVLRGFYIAYTAQDTFGRLLAASLSFTFFIYIFVNSGMVSGLLPVVGVPLPLVSYGGTSMVTLLAGFGMLMAIQNERRLISK